MSVANSFGRAAHPPEPSDVTTFIAKTGESSGLNQDTADTGVTPVVDALKLRLWGMNHQLGTRESQRDHSQAARARVTRRKGRRFPQLQPALFRALGSRLSHRLVWHLYTAGLILCNIWLAWVAGELLDLYISAVELWTEMATKHLELTL